MTNLNTQLIFTHHARDRLQSRSISTDKVARALSHPDITARGEKPGTTKFIKRVSDREIHVIGKYLSDQKKWLIISVWVRGEEDKVPLVWQAASLPFKSVWWLLKRSGQFMLQLIRK